jgi:predicted small integral membrane protein
MNQQQQANPTARTRRGARALIWGLRATRNVLALLGVFFVYLLWHGMAAYEADMASSSAAVTCVKPSRCM